MTCVHLDTQILIWGIKEECTEGQENMILTAKRFLQWLEEEEIEVAVSSVVFGELLARVPIDRHSEIWSELGGRDFIIHPYDGIAASQAARVWRAGKESGFIDALAGEEKTGRAIIKADCQIIGTAISRKASTIYSHDNGLRSLARGFIAVEPMPNIQTTPPT